MQADPREGLPSSSSFSRYAHCAGSYLAEKNLPAIVVYSPEGNKDSEHGDTIHRALKGEDVELTDEQKETFDMCRKLERDWLATFNLDLANVLQRRERRYWLMDESLNKLLSGQIDYAVLGYNQAWVVDYKTLFGDHEKADENYQLMVNAVLIDEYYGNDLERVYVALIQPWKKGQITVAEYDRAALDNARKEVLRILKEINKPDAFRTPGKWCQFCKAVTECPQAQGQMWALKIATSNILSHPEKLREYYLLWKIIEPRGKLLTDLIKARLKQDPNSIPGLKLEPGDERRQVTNVIEAWRALSNSGITEAEFSALLDFKFGDAEALLKEKYFLKSKKAAAARLNEILSGVIEKKQNAPSIAIEKGIDLIP